MKTKKQHFTWGLLILFLLISFKVQSQISFQGLYSEGEGGVAWDADGTGPEPYGYGHTIAYYYVSTRDYVDPASGAGVHFLDTIIGFPVFVQALADNGFTAGQVKIRQGLSSLGNDEEGMDWFEIGNMHYTNYCPFYIEFLINGEPMISGTGAYFINFIGPLTNNQWFTQSSYLKPQNVSANSSAAVQAVATAFMQDMEGLEIKIQMQSTSAGYILNGNGRSGTYVNFTGTLQKGLPQLPIQGLAINHEGFAGWDTDGTGPEPKRNGHDDQLYYIASRDYDDIDPDPSAAFARMLENGMDGFQNFALQLAYRGYNPEQVKLKMGISDVDEDINGEDWSYINYIHKVNYYHSHMIAELDGEPLFGFVCDTLTSYQDALHPSWGWWGTSSFSPLYDASANSSTDVQMVAESFFRDLADRNICNESSEFQSVPGTINSCGRQGGFWEVVEAKLVASEAKGTVIPEGEVSGTWALAGHPYIVKGEITIPDGQTLTIEPGVWVKFTDRKEFIVNGCIKAIGDTSNTGAIKFTAVNPDLGWGHIGFDSTAVTNEESVFMNCIFEHGYAPDASPWNSPYNCGGAIGVRDYNKIHIENCLFRNNRALNDAFWIASGGAIALWNSSPVIRNCVFSNNSANWSGAITCYLESSPYIVNCLFYGNISRRNISDGGGAIIVSANSNPILLNNTFVNNHSNFRGGAIEIYSGSYPDLINNIFWGNTAPQNNQVFISSNDCNVDFKYNNIEGGQAGIGPFGIGTGVYENNIDIDPGFADQLAWNFQLSTGSPCLDGGTPDTTGLNLPLYDLLYNVRFWDGDYDGHSFVDMGPYEYGAPLYNEFKERKADSPYSLLTCYPNPCTERVEIRYENEEAGMVKLIIYNQLGQPVDYLINQAQGKGVQIVTWNASDLPSGIYYLRLQSGIQTATTKIILSK
jgi:hypothetical protein